MIGTATLLMERKATGDVGHIEDVVVDSACRGQRLIVRHLIEEGLHGLGCRTVALDCSKDNASFYEKCRLSYGGMQVRIGAKHAAAPHAEPPTWYFRRARPPKLRLEPESAAVLHRLRAPRHQRWLRVVVGDGRADVVIGKTLGEPDVRPAR